MIYRKTGIALPSSLSPSGFRESTKQHRALKHMKGIQPGLLTNSYLSRPQFTGTAAEESIRSHLPHADRKWGHYQTGAWCWQITTILSVSRISERKFLLYIDGELCLFLCARNHFSRCFSVFTPSGCWNSNLVMVIPRYFDIPCNWNECNMVFTWYFNVLLRISLYMSKKNSFWIYFLLQMIFWE